MENAKIVMVEWWYNGIIYSIMAGSQAVSVYTEHNLVTVRVMLKTSQEETFEHVFKLFFIN